MYIRSKIIVLAVLLSSCTKIDNTDIDGTNIDTIITKSEYNTTKFRVIIDGVDSVELDLWASVGFKIDSLIQRNRELERRLKIKPVMREWRPRVVDKNGNVKILPSINELKNRTNNKDIQ